MNINIISTFRDNETKEQRLNNVITGLPRWHSGKESACNSGDAGSIPGQEDPLEREMAMHSSILAW